MIRTSLLIASSVLALSACQPASDAPQDTVVAEAPPVVSEDAVVEEVEAPVAEPEATADVAADTEDMAAEEDHDHAHDGDHEHDHSSDAEHEDDHDHDEAHDHEDGHDHGDAHDHGDDHDHDHDHAGGEAHVHGLSDLAVSLDGASVSVSLEGALANFDLDESLRTVEDPAPYTDGIVTLIGGDCTRDQAGVSIRPIGDHGNMMIDMTYSCAAIDSLEAIDVTGFANFSGFEEVNAVVLTESGQTAKTLSASETRLDLR